VISEQKIAEIRQVARISEFITPHVALKRRGRALLGLCPFHNEKTPSFSVDDERGFYHCFGCSAGGNVFKFLMEIERLTFPEAVRKVADRYGIEVPETDAPVERRDPSFYEINVSAARYYRRFLCESEHGQRFRDYLGARAIDEAAAERFLIGAASPSGTGLVRWLAREGVDLRKAAALGLVVSRGGHAYDRFRDRLMFPIRDSQGRVIGFGGRQIESGEGPKYLNSPESEVYQKSRALYGIYEARDALRRGSTVLLVEGYMDVIALHQAGVEHAVATCGTALTLDQARMIRRHAGEVVALFDGDAAGKRAAARSFPIFIEAGLWAKGMTLPESEDPDSFVRARGPEELQRRLAQAVPLAEAYVEHSATEAGGDSSALARVGADLAAVLAKVSDPFEYDLLLRKAAHWTGFSQDVLRRQARHASAAAASAVQRHAHAGHAGAGKRGGAPGPEELVVTLLLGHPELIARVAESGLVERMESSVWRDIARDILAAGDAGTGFDTAQALERLPDFWRTRMAARLTEGTTGDAAVRARVLEDCIRRIEEAARRRHNASLLGRVRKDEQIASGEIPIETLTEWRPRTSSDA
jgi:DNA primase